VLSMAGTESLEGNQQPVEGPFKEAREQSQHHDDQTRANGCGDKARQQGTTWLSYLAPPSVLLSVEGSLRDGFGWSYRVEFRLQSS
jgi:hypothetical protein